MKNVFSKLKGWFSTKPQLQEPEESSTPAPQDSVYFQTCLEAVNRSVTFTQLSHELVVNSVGFKKEWQKLADMTQDELLQYQYEYPIFHHFKLFTRAKLVAALHKFEQEGMRQALLETIASSIYHSFRLPSSHLVGEWLADEKNMNDLMKTYALAIYRVTPLDAYGMVQEQAELYEARRRDDKAFDDTDLIKGLIQHCLTYEQAALEAYCSATSILEASRCYRPPSFEAVMQIFLNITSHRKEVLQTENQVRLVLTYIGAKYNLVTPRWATCAGFVDYYAIKLALNGQTEPDNQPVQTYTVYTNDEAPTHPSVSRPHLVRVK